MKITSHKTGVYFSEMIIPEEILKLQSRFCSNFIKIGQAVDIENRFDDLQTGNPFNLKIKGFIPLTKDKKLLKIEEDRAKNYFANHYYRGEWYLNIKHLIKDYVKLRIKDLTNQEMYKEVI